MNITRAHALSHAARRDGFVIVTTSRGKVASVSLALNVKNTGLALCVCEGIWRGDPTAFGSVDAGAPFDARKSWRKALRKIKLVRAFGGKFDMGFVIPPEVREESEV